MPRKADPPDIEMRASVKARTVRYARAPRTEVRRVGEWTSASDRRNLPDEVEPKVTYRDVRIRWRSEARVRARALR
jgi:hypothetical protein